MTEKPDNYKERLALVRSLASELNVDLKDVSVAVATPQQSAKLRHSNGQLEAVIYSTGDLVRISSPRLPKIHLRLVDLNNPRENALAPEGAVYMVEAISFNEDGTYSVLNGDIYQAHVGLKGFLLNSAARQRARKLSENIPYMFEKR